MKERETYGPSITETKTYPEPSTECPDWRHLFRENVLRAAEKEKENIDFVRGWGNSIYSYRRSTIYTNISRLPSRLGQTFDKDTGFECRCGHRFCVHEAALMLKYEERHGPVIIREHDYEYRERLDQLKMNDFFTEVKERQNADGMELISAIEFFDDLPSPSGIVRFDMDKIIRSCVTTRYHIKTANALLDEYSDHMHPSLSKTREGDEWIELICTFQEYGFLNWTRAMIKVGPDRILDSSRTSPRYGRPPIQDFWAETDNFLNEFHLVMLYSIWKYTLTLNEEDYTDDKAEDFFRNLEVQENEAIYNETEVRRIPSIEMMPKIVIEDGEAKVSFKAGMRGGRMFIIKNLQNFNYCVKQQKVFDLTKKESLDFSTYDFTPESRKLADFVMRRVGEMNAVNAQMWNKTGRELAITYQQSLYGALLDHFYDAAAGRTAEFTDKTNNVKDAEISIGYTKMHFTLKVEDLHDSRGNFLGVAVSGLIPVKISGSSSQYILNASYLSRMNAEEIRVLKPFLSVADASGYFRFQVGLAKLQEFYYRVLPSLLNSPHVRLENDCSEELNRHLPPEPAFTFYVDYVDGCLRLSAKVTYDEKTYTVNAPDRDGAYRDELQEKRVDRFLRRLFDGYDPKGSVYTMVPSEDQLFDFLQKEIGALSRYGSVMVSNTLSSFSVRRIPAVNFGISVKSGLLDLSLTSTDLSPQELADVLAAYQNKRKYHRLKTGEFISLQEDPQIQQLLEIFESMELVPADIIKKNVHLPVFRALYLDHMLEGHEAVASSRDRTFRSLVKSFRTVRDADYDLPSALEPVLRPYQTFGYKWLRTLASSGFGGILADEMGLGKTLQMISVFDAMKQEGNEKPNLVISPASLVYNWQEEIRRFAPDLKVLPLASGSAARKKQLQRLKEGSGEYDVYVTSYDLLKRDIAHYEGIPFACCVLDEAQFIKNQKTTAAKAVKVLQSDYRFALTGTPIENRLSELWSIFDFLMPGFLYSAKEFSSQYEVPIVKSHDEAVTEKLKNMVSPFILRRRKEDVLTDLPAKLEEVRYAVMEGQQQKLYDAEVSRMRKMIESGSSPEDRFRVFAELTRIREICCDPSLLFENYDGESAKRTACLDLIRSAIDGGHRMLVFSQFTSMLELLEKDLSAAEIPYFKLTGETSKPKRLQLVHAFNEEGEVPVFLISLKAGGTGLNLTGADMVIHYDPWWNLAATSQATDRAHRIGQTKQVTVYKMIARGTIEERIMDIQNTKHDLAEAVLAGSADSLMTLSPEELLALLN